jgi:hypothetical protein
MGLIDDIPTCQELLTRIERQAVEALTRSKALYTEAQPRSNL